MITLPGNLTSPTAGSILTRGASARYANGGRVTVLGVESTHAHVYDGAADRRVYSPLDALSLDLTADLGPTIALRWLGRHYGVDVGIGCPEWTYHHDEHGGWYRLRGVGGEVVFFSTGHPASGTTKAGATWVALPTLPTNPLQALVAACLHAAGVPRE